MSIFKRGRTYWFHFWFNGEHVQRSSRQGNPRVARQIEAAERTRLAKGEVGIRDRKPIPTFNVAMNNFLSWSATEHCAHPRTHTRYVTSRGGCGKIQEPTYWGEWETIEAQATPCNSQQGVSVWQSDVQLRN